MFFLRRSDSGENTVIFDEFRVVVGFGGGKIITAEILDADAGGDGFDRFEFVAGDDFDVNIVIVEVVNDVFSVRADFVFEANVP